MIRKVPIYAQRWLIWLLSIVAALISAFVVVKLNSGKDLLTAVQRFAFINAGFIVAAFNLRFRMLDLFAKDWFKRTEFDALSEVMQRCTKRINHQIIFHVLVSALMGAAPLGTNFNLWIQATIVAVAFGAFALGLGKFLQVLESFARLESLACSAIKREIERRDQEEIQSLFNEEGENL